MAMSGIVEKMGARNMLRDQTENISMGISNLYSGVATAIEDHQCIEAFAQTLWHRSGVWQAPEKEEGGAYDGGEAGAASLADGRCRLDVGGERGGAQEAAEGRAHAVSNESLVALQAHHSNASVPDATTTARHRHASARNFQQPGSAVHTP